MGNPIIDKLRFEYYMQRRKPEVKKPSDEFIIQEMVDKPLEYYPSYMREHAILTGGFSLMASIFSIASYPLLKGACYYYNIAPLFMNGADGTGRRTGDYYLDYAFSLGALGVLSAGLAAAGVLGFIAEQYEIFKTIRKNKRLKKIKIKLSKTEPLEIKVQESSRQAL
jgi:hypothetical protein